MMIISTKGLSKSYPLGKTLVPAVRNVSLDIKQGEFVAIRGASGSGKSTLLYVLGLLSRSDGGTYNLCGMDTAALSQDELARLRNRAIGFVFQQFCLLQRASTLHNVALPGVYRDGWMNWQRARECLDIVGLSDLANRRPNELSGGQQQRVAVARALVTDPLLILADEPTGNLDSHNADALMAVFEKLHKGGITIVLITHEPDIAAHAQRQVIMHDGEIQSDSSGAGAAEAQAGSEVGCSSPGISLETSRAHIALACLLQAFRAMRSHVLRSALSVLGVLVGTFAVLMTVVLIAGAQEAVRLQMETLGTNLMVLIPQAVKGTGAGESDGTTRLTREDAKAVAGLPEVRAVACVTMGRAQISSDGRRARQTPVVGAEPEFADLSANKPSAGRFFNTLETDRKARVVVLGATPIRELLGDVDPVGQTVKINGIEFKVIGETPAHGVNPWRDPDDVAVIPITTAMRQIIGRTDIDQIQIEVQDGCNMVKMEEAVRAVLKKRHPGGAMDGEGLRVRDMARVRRAYEDISSILSRLLQSVSIVSLIVGGIGIMNIMLVSVTERTREVGLRKALGARFRDIMRQFLAEAVLLSMAGGAAGVGCGLVVIRVMAQYGTPATGVLPAVVMAFGAAALTGVVFGLWPAWTAAKRDAVESLRFE